MVLNIDFMGIIYADFESFLMRVLKVGHPHLSPHVTFLLWERLYHSLGDFLYNKLSFYMLRNTSQGRIGIFFTLYMINELINSLICLQYHSAPM